MISPGRITAAALSLSAVALVNLALFEGYTDRAVIPTKGDKPTVGFGSTTHADGRAVRMGDKTTPPQALARTLAYIQQDEVGMKRSLAGVPLHQAEYDIYMDWRYQYGATAWEESSMLRHLKAGKYSAACSALLKYKYSAGFDCSTPGNKVCPGVWDRQLKRYAACKAAQ